jgi:integral membrane sensor domain MASE1
MQGRRSRERSTRAAQLAALALTYAVVGRLGLSISHVSGFASLVWAPTALSLVALWVGGTSLWPAVAIGAFATNFWVGAPVPVALGIAAGNTLEAILAVHLLRRVDFRGSLARVGDVIALVVLAGVVSTVVSATVGTGSLALGGIVRPAELGRTWGVWRAGDFIADVALAPLLLTWWRGARLEARPAALAEAAGLGTALVGLAGIVFFQPPWAGAWSTIFRPSLLFVLLIWAALRFGTRGAATAAFAVALVALAGTYAGHGPLSANAGEIEGRVAPERRGAATSAAHHR